MQCRAVSWASCRTELREFMDSSPNNAHNPFMSWEFVDCVHTVRGDVEAGILTQGNCIVGFLPFQRRAGGRAIPVASYLNDLHGPIGCELSHDDMVEVLCACGLSRFDFQASPPSRWNNSVNKVRAVAAFRAELGLRPIEYIDGLYASHYSVRQQRRKTRALERKFGPLRLEWESSDSAAFDALVKWKSAVYQRMGIRNLFSRPWIVELLRRLWTPEKPDFPQARGQLSGLYAGNSRIAVHYGLRCGNVLHSWFPAYSDEFAQFSPGIELFLRLMQRGPTEGVTTLDYGYGAEPFKEKLSNQNYRVMAGAIDLVPWRRTLLALSESARQHVKQLPWSKGMKRLMRQASSTFAPPNYE